MNDNNIFFQISYRGYIINITYDDYAENPRSLYEHLGTLYTSHKKYQPEQNFDDHFDIDNVFNKNLEFLPSFEREYIALPVYLYDHSGLAVSTTPFGYRWDSGLFGIIAVSVEKVRNEYSWKKITPKRRDIIKKYLEYEIKELNDYYHGSVYGFTITSIDNETNIIDSRWDIMEMIVLNVLKKNARHISMLYCGR